MMEEPLQSAAIDRGNALRHPPPASLRYRRFNVAAIVLSHVLPTAGVLYVLSQMVLYDIYPSTLDLSLCLGFYFLTLLGLEVGYHRYFAHRAFKTSKFFEAVLALLGTVTFEGGVIWWTGTHKRHHAFSDAEGDPHSPYYGRHGGVSGFVYAHFGWLFNPHNTNLGPWIQHVMPMYRDRRLVFMNRYYFQLGLAFLLLLALIGGLASASLKGAWSAFLWGGLVRVFLVTHAIFSINSVCHMFGARPFRHSRDESRNSAWLSIYTLGASWHNNHHAFPRTASNRLRWWELDIAGMVIWLLETLGIVWDVWRPSRELVQARRTGVGEQADGHDAEAHVDPTPPTD